jgi:hypothetical protein
MLVLLFAACAPPPRQPPPYYGTPTPYGGAREHACTDLASATTRGSICFPDLARCEEERRRAANDGLEAQPCRPQSPVACFAGAAGELCAASVEDCELLRLIDRDKSGSTGPACAWR